MTSLHEPFPGDAGDSVNLATTEEPAVIWRASRHRITVDRQHEGRRNRRAAECPALPRIHPGELWIVEHASADQALSPLGRHAITSANVVIYDRALYPIVAANLPRGGYAEPESWPGGAIDNPVDRSIQFARDGWSVVRLADRRSLRDGRVARLVDRMIAAGCPAAISVTLFANADASVPQPTETELRRLAIAIAATNPEVSLAIAFAAVGTGTAPHLYEISCNGLAG